MRFSKWHALGNAYLVVERDDAGPLTPERARLLCDVRLGIGADGVLEVVASDLERSTVEIAIWNPDGSSAEMSGNGTRLAAAWLLAQNGSDLVLVRTVGGDVPCRRLDDGRIEQQLGGVTVAPSERLMVGETAVDVIPVDVGNPHVVVATGDLSREALLALGPALETHPRFPAGTNVQLARPAGRRVLQVLVWERGAGETTASGSSAVAAAAAAVERGWCDSPVTVRFPGGDLTVAVDGDRATLAGPAEWICSGSTTLLAGGPAR